MTYLNVGGLFGKVGSGPNPKTITITDSSNHGDIMAQNQVAGILGHASAFNGTLNLTRVYNYGDIYSTNTESEAGPIISTMNGTVTVNATDVYNCGGIYNNRKAGSTGKHTLMQNKPDTEICYVQGMDADGNNKTSNLSANDFFNAYYKPYSFLQLSTTTVADSVYVDGQYGNIDSINNKQITIDTSSLSALNIKKVRVTYFVSSWTVEYGATTQDNTQSGNMIVGSSEATVDSLGSTYIIPKMKYVGQTWAKNQGCPDTPWASINAFEKFHVDDATANQYPNKFTLLEDGSAVVMIDNRNVDSGTYNLVSSVASGFSYSLVFINGDGAKVATLSFFDLTKGSDTYIKAISEIA